MIRTKFYASKHQTSNNNVTANALPNRIGLFMFCERLIGRYSLLRISNAYCLEKDDKLDRSPRSGCLYSSKVGRQKHRIPIFSTMFKLLTKAIISLVKGEEPSFTDDVSKPGKEDETTSLLSSTSTKHYSSSTLASSTTAGTTEATEQLYRQQLVSSEHSSSSIEDMEFGANGFLALTFPSPMQSGKGRWLNYNYQKKRMFYYLLTKVGMCTTLIVLTSLALVAAPFAVGPPSQPVGAYKLVEAHAGHDFWEYYTFFDGRDSVGSHGHIVYVSEEKARMEGIVDVVTETVRPEDMIEVYEEDDPRAVENWLAEDLAFLKESKRKESEYAEGTLKSAIAAIKEEEAEEEKKKADNSESSSSSAKKKKKANRKKEANRFLGEEEQAPVLGEGETELKPPKLEPFNADPSSGETAEPEETFVYISSSPSAHGPRNSVRLEGRRRFNRGLFIIDLRHLPVSCGSWPAFWLTDEENWPKNGEIDIIEGVNYQDSAKLALHTSKECHMDDVPEGLKTGGWDTSVGFIDNKTGKPDMTLRYAKSCFAYEQHQWLNQGCVAMDLKQEGKSLGKPLNDNGGGVYVMEWDPLHNYIKAWVFAPHNRVPSNLRNALRTASNTDESTRVSPDTSEWGLPYAYFPIGDGTQCSSEHFRNMRLVINLAFCGSMAGERYYVDCPRHVRDEFQTCNDWIESDPEELKEAYWKIRGVYVYEREWKKQW